MNKHQAFDRIVGILDGREWDASTIEAVAEVLEEALGRDLNAPRTFLARDILLGDRFPSPRREEGVVTAMCPFGECDQDDRPDSVHVRDKNGAEFFIPLIPDEEIHLCHNGCPSFASTHKAEEREQHRLINKHHR